MELSQLLYHAYRRCRVALEKYKYTPYTMAEYWRKLGAQVGEGCFLIPSELGTEPYLVKVGNHVAVAADVHFMTHDGGPWIFRDQVPDLQVFGPIVIEDNCLIGQRATIFPNVRIGANSIVAASSVVIADVPPNSLVMGVPARPFGSLEKYREKCLERWAQQRPPDVIMSPGETWWNTSRGAEHRRRLKDYLLQVFHEQLGDPEK